MRRKILLTALLSSFVLGACGVKGELKTPPPIFGDKTKQQQDDKTQNPDGQDKPAQPDQDNASDDSSNP